MRRLLSVATAVAVALSLCGTAHAAPEPGSPEHRLRDLANQQAAFGRTFSQLTNPAYLLAALSQLGPVTYATWLEQARHLNRPSLSLQTLIPPAAMGNPLRKDWAGTRGRKAEVSFTNRYGALLRGTVYAPLPGARDPYTSKPLTGPFPSVVITPGSIQGMRSMYTWLAQDLAERGYVVLTFDVQGQGQSETFPHLGEIADLPSCDINAEPLPGEQTGCPGFTSQQFNNFAYGTQDAISFFQSTPAKPFTNVAQGSLKADAFNPFWESVDASPDPRSAVPGRTGRLAVIGHSLGAAAASYVQGIDPRVNVIVALDKLGLRPGIEPVVPALALQAEYSWLPERNDDPDPHREKARGYDKWTGADRMLIVSRGSTHLDWTDLPLVLPASRYGQQLSSVYTQAWLDKYLKHDPAADAVLTSDSFRYLEPGTWSPITLKRDSLLSFYFCSAYSFGGRTEPDVTKVGCTN